MTRTSGDHLARGLLPQSGALLNAETVLFVDDHRPERAEGYGVGQQRMRADQDVHRAVVSARHGVGLRSRAGVRLVNQHDQ